MAPSLRTSPSPGCMLEQTSYPWRTPGRTRTTRSSLSSLGRCAVISRNVRDWVTHTHTHTHPVSLSVWFQSKALPVRVPLPGLAPCRFLQARHLDRKHVVFGEILREDGQAEPVA